MGLALLEGPFSGIRTAVALQWRTTVTGGAVQLERAGFPRSACGMPIIA